MLDKELENEANSHNEMQSQFMEEINVFEVEANPH